MIHVYGEGEVIDNRYLVKKAIGGGGFGKVVHVMDQQNGEDIALKYCFSNEEENINRFKREIRIMKSIVHENVIRIIESNVEHNPPYFTMPLALYPVTKEIPKIQGETEKSFRIIEAICKGVKAIHNSGHTHRDIKPDNILIFPDGKIVVSDLGLAKLDNRDTTILTRASIYIGSEDYMPPEQRAYGGTRDVDHSGDVYSLGKTIYSILTGRSPVLLDQNTLHPAIWVVLKKATRDNPAERYQTVDALLDALNGAIRLTVPETNPKTMFEELLKVTDENLKRNEYEEENVRQILQIIYSLEDYNEYIEAFHKIPNRIIHVYVTTFPTEFEPIMQKYKAAINEEIGGYPFGFAEKVADCMKIVFSKSGSEELKKNALLSTLFAGVRLNRWVAMGVFDDLLIAIKDDFAYVIAQELRDEKCDYSRLYDRIPQKELHPAIQAVWEECYDESKRSINGMEM